MPPCPNYALCSRLTKHTSLIAGPYHAFCVRPLLAVPAADAGVGRRGGGSGDPSVSLGGGMMVGPPTTWDSASDVGESSKRGDS